MRAGTIDAQQFGRTEWILGRYHAVIDSRLAQGG
jgi:hypothetical protein